MRLVDRHARTEPFTTAPAPKASLLRLALAGVVVLLVGTTRSPFEAPVTYLATGLALVFGVILLVERPGFIAREGLVRPLVDSALLCVLVAGAGGGSSPFFPLYLLAALEVVRAAGFARIAVATAALTGSYLAAATIAAGGPETLDPLVVGQRAVLVALFCAVAGVLGAEARAQGSLNADLSKHLTIERDRTKSVETLLSELGPALGTLDIEGLLRWTAEAARVVSGGTYAHVAALDGGSHRTVLEGDPEVCPSWWHPAIQRLVLWSCLEGEIVRGEEPVHGMESFMAVPVGSEGEEKWGAIVVGGREFDAEDERALKVLAGAVGRVLQEAVSSPGGLDQVSGLPNRASLHRVLRRELSRGRPLTVVAVGVDGLRHYEKERGPSLGDALLRRLGERLAEDQRLAFRYGEETFVVVLGGYKEARTREAASSLERIVSQEAAASSFPLSTSVGVALAETGDEDAEDVLEAAVRALDTTGASEPDYEGDLRISGVVRAFMETLETRDPGISDHLRAVCDLSQRIGSRLSLAPDQLDALAPGALLHDVGKIGIPEHILQKPGRLTVEEYEVVRRHPALGARMLAPIRELAPALAVVKHHHERLDGQGYPEGLRGEEIPLAARIVSVADAFDAMMRDRPYGYGIPLGAALEEIIRGSGSRFDPEVVDALLEIEGEVRRSDSAG